MLDQATIPNRRGRSAAIPHSFKAGDAVTWTAPESHGSTQQFGTIKRVGLVTTIVRDRRSRDKILSHEFAAKTLRLDTLHTPC